MRYIIGAFLLVVLCTVNAQTSVNEVLAAQVSSVEMIDLLAREDFLKSHKFSSPWLRELDFRMRSKDTEVSIEEYRVRFGLINPFEIKANKDYRSILIDQQAFQKHKRINDLLHNRYELLLESYFLDQSLEMNQNYITNLEEIRGVLMSGKIDMKDIIQFEKELTQSELRIADLLRKKEVVRTVLKRYGVIQWPDWQSFRMIEITQVEGFMMSSMADSSSIEAMEMSMKLERAEGQLKIDKSESFSNIGFIQAEYDKTGDVFEERLGFQVGVNVPLFNNDRPKLERDKLDIIEGRAEYKQVQQEEQNQRAVNQVYIKSIIDQVNMIGEKQHTFDTLMRAYTHSDWDIDSFLEIKEYELFLKEKELGCRTDILMRFIELLYRSGQLAGEPHQNYLSSTLDEFELNFE